MKKMIISMFCSILALGVAGCGSKETTLLNNPKDSDVEKVIKKLMVQKVLVLLQKIMIQMAT